MGDKRMTVEECLRHKWFHGHVCPCSKADPAVAQGAFESIMRFRDENRFFHVAATTLARQLGASDTRVQEVRKVFQELDVDHDGCLSIKELKNGMDKLFDGNMDMAQVEALFVKLDLDGSGGVDYTEFVAMAISEHMAHQDHLMHAAFRVFDKNGDGFLDQHEIQSLLKSEDGEGLSEAFSNELREESAMMFGQSGGNRINFADFCQIMRKNANARLLARAEKDSPALYRTLTGDYSQHQHQCDHKHHRPFEAPEEAIDAGAYDGDWMQGATGWRVDTKENTVINKQSLKAFTFTVLPGGGCKRRQDGNEVKGNYDKAGKRIVWDDNTTWQRKSSAAGSSCCSFMPKCSIM